MFWTLSNVDTPPKTVHLLFGLFVKNHALTLIGRMTCAFEPITPVQKQSAPYVVVTNVPGRVNSKLKCP